MSIWIILPSKKELDLFKNYIKESILKPYLIHIEFEIMNTLTQLKTDKIIEKIYSYKGFNFEYLIDATNTFLYRIRNLIKVMEF